MLTKSRFFEIYAPIALTTCFLLSTMSPPTVTPSKHANGIDNLTTTYSKKNAGDRLLFTTLLTTQDLQQKCSNILDILKGDDERAKAKITKTKDM